MTWTCAFITRHDPLTVEYLSYADDLDPAWLMSGLDNTVPAPEFSEAEADLILDVDGYERTGKWTYTDDIWCAVITEKT